MRIRRSILNFATSTLFMLVTMLVGLKAAPYLRLWLGLKGVGGYRVIFEGYGYLTLLELGLGGAMGPLLARALAERDEPRLRATIAAGHRAYLGVSLVTVLVGLAATPIIPWFAADVVGVQVSDLQRGWIVGLIGFLSLILLPLRTMLEARQLGYVVNLLLTAQSLLITGVSLWLARAGWGITGQALAQALGTWIFSVVVAVIVLRTHPGLLRGLFTTPPAAEARRALWSLSLPTLAINASGRVGLLTDNLVVGALLGTESVASFFFTQRLVNIGQGVLQAVGTSSWAALAELHAQGERATFNRRLIEISRLVAIFAAAGLAPVVAFNEDFLRIWMKGTVPYAGDVVTILAAINVAMLAELSLWVWCFTATGRIGTVVVPTIIGAILNLVVSVVMTRKLGLPGPLIGTTVAFTGISLWLFPILLRRVYGTSLRELAWALVPSALLGTAAVIALRGVVRGWYPPSGWISLIAVVAGSGLTILVLAVMMLPAEERHLWSQRFRAFRPR